jgi:ABC-type multidrug transport system permease subunit
MKRFLAVLKARNNEFIRDTSALGWNLIFPILVIFGFAFAFSDSSQNIFKVAVFSNPAAQSSSSQGFTGLKYIQFVPTQDVHDSLEKLKRHHFDMVLNQEGPGQGKYWINSSSPKGYLLEKILWGSGASQDAYQKQSVEGKEIRYVDWLISGLLGMNMMFSALFGVGYTIVRYRKNGVLKRLKATPVTSFEFLLAQVISRLLLISFVTTAVYCGSHYFIRFQMLGSYISLFFVMVLGAMSMISLSLLVASRSSSEEFAGGLLNLISWPMMFLSGVWFSLEGSHPWVIKAAQLFPLTHLIDAARAIMTEGATLQQVSYNVITMSIMTLVFLTAGSLTFKWK